MHKYSSGNGGGNDDDGGDGGGSDDGSQCLLRHFRIQTNEMKKVCACLYRPHSYTLYYKQKHIHRIQFSTFIIIARATSSRSYSQCLCTWKRNRFTAKNHCGVVFPTSCAAAPAHRFRFARRVYSIPLHIHMDCASAIIIDVDVT